MIEWINPEDRLPEENCPVLIRVDKDIHVAYLRRAKQEEHSSAYAWLPFDNSMGWFPFQVSSWAEIPMGQKDTNAVESKPEELHTFDYNSAMMWPSEDASCWAEIPNVQKYTNSVESEPEKPTGFDYNNAAKWLMLITLFAILGNCKAEPKSGWFYKDSGKEYKGAIYTGKDMFADKDGNEIIYIPPSKR